MKIKKDPFIYALVFIPAANVFAAENVNDIKFGVSASTRLSDNALRQPTDTIKERQNQLSADVDVNYENEWSSLKVNYDASWHRFEHESQEDRSILQGETELSLGGLYQPFNLLLTHSRRSLLNTPDAIDLIGNRDERDVVSARPTVKWKINSSDALAFSATYSTVSYKFDESRDSKIEGLNLVWQIGLSKVDSLTVLAQQNNIRFDEAPLFDYKLQSASIKYSVDLNNLSYFVGVGGNKIVSDTDTGRELHPAFDVSASYGTGYNTFKFIANKKITDTSMGDGNDVGLGVSSGDSLGKGIDLVDLTIAQLSWSTTALCERCQTNVNAFGVRQDYQNTSQSYDEKGIGAGFNYRFTKAASFYLNASHSNRTFEPGSLRTDFTMNRINVGFMYKFQNDLQLKVYRFQEKRNSVVFAETYVEHYSGLSLTYNF